MNFCVIWRLFLSYLCDSYIGSYARFEQVCLKLKDIYLQLLNSLKLCQADLHNMLVEVSIVITLRFVVGEQTFLTLFYTKNKLKNNVRIDLYIWSLGHMFNNFVL
jgi:hypothetical protein